MQASRDLKRALTRQLRVQPLDAEAAYRELRATDAYVRLLEDKTLLREDPVDRLFEIIDLNPSLPTVQLLSGFRGTGKTTALLRLRDRLVAGGYAAIRIDVRQYLNTSSPVGVDEFLLFLAASAVTEARAQELVPEGEVQGLLKRGRDWLARVRVHGATVELGGEHAKVAVELGLADADRLAELRKSIAGRSREFARDIHTDLKELRAAVAQHGDGRELVIIVDSVEQYRGTLGAEGTAVPIQRSMNELFAGNSDLLDPRVPGLHLVYTVPPYLSALAPGIGVRFDPGGLTLIPAVKVRERNGAEFKPGIDALIDLVGRRITAALHETGHDHADDPWQIISRDAVSRIVVATGGVVRTLVSAVTGVVSRVEGLPAEDRVVELALSRLREEYVLNDEDAAVLAEVLPDAPPPIADQGEGLAIWAYQLDVGNVLCYENGEAWYAINPLIRRRLDMLIARARERREARPTAAVEGEQH